MIDLAPSSIIIDLLTQEGIVNTPLWPAYESHMPNENDDAVGVYDIDPEHDGRLMTDGTVILHYGIRVVVRSAEYADGWAKAYAITQIFDSINKLELLEDTYPTTNLGYETVFASPFTTLNRRALPVTIVEDGHIHSVTMYMGTSQASGNVLLGVYDNGVDDLPNALLATSAVTPLTNVSGAIGWQTLSMVFPPEVSAGDTIWLAFVADVTLTGRFSIGTPGRAASSDLWTGSLPSSFGSSTQSNNLYSMYATFSSNPHVGIHNMSRRAGISSMGLEAGTQRRFLFNVEYTMTIERV